MYGKDHHWQNTSRVYAYVLVYVRARIHVCVVKIIVDKTQVVIMRYARMYNKTKGLATLVKEPNQLNSHMTHLRDHRRQQRGRNLGQNEAPRCEHPGSGWSWNIPHIDKQRHIVQGNLSAIISGTPLALCASHRAVFMTMSSTKAYPNMGHCLWIDFILYCRLTFLQLHSMEAWPNVTHTPHLPPWRYATPA